MKNIHPLSMLFFLCLSLIACVSEEPKSSTEQENNQDQIIADMVMVDQLIDMSILDARIDIIPDATTIDMAVGCQSPDDCNGFPCEDGECQYECVNNQDCGRFQSCVANACSDRCFGPGTCFRGGVCVNGVCIEEQCAQDSDCEMGKLCREQLCVDPKPCMDNSECATGARCVDGNCEPLGRCGGDANCASDEICNNGKCEQRQDCSTDPNLCMMGEICIAGRCVPDLCRGAEDCATNEICQAGNCEPIAMDIMLEKVVILNRPQSLTLGQSLQLRAVGLDAQGDIVVSEGFTWSVNDANLGSISGSALLSTGPNTGTIEIVATWERNGQAIDSDPLRIQILPLPMPLEDGWRIRLSDQSDGLPITQAQVYLNQRVFEPDMEGIVYIDPMEQISAPISFTVMAAGYDTVSIIGVSRREIHIPMSPLSDDSVIAGFTGEFNFERINNQGEVKIGLAGGAFADGISQISLFDILGNFFLTDVELGPVSATLPLPGGLTLSAQVPLLGDVTVKNNYSVIAHSGFQLAWGFAGKIAISTVLGLLQGGGRPNLGTILGTILPFFDQFSHGVRAVDQLNALPPVADVDDIDRDGNRRELLPDFANFPSINLSPAQIQNLRLAVQVPAPVDGLDGTPINIVLTGVEVVDVGFIPLGLSATQDAATVPMRMAPPYQGLQSGDYVVLALSARFINNIPRNLSGLIYKTRQLPAQVNLGNGFMVPPANSTWSPATRRVSTEFVENADLVRVSFRGGVGRWVVYMSAGNTTASLPFPQNPDQTPDLTVGLDVRFDLLDLEDGISWEEIIGEGGMSDLDHLDQHVKGFGRFVDNGGR